MKLVKSSPLCQRTEFQYYNNVGVTSHIIHTWVNGSLLLLLAAYSNFFHKSGKTENFWVAAICSFSNSLMIRHSINCPLLYSLERWISQKLKIQSSSNSRGALQKQIPSSSAFFIRFTDFSHFFTASDSNSSNFDSYSIRTTPICKKNYQNKTLEENHSVSY